MMASTVKHTIHRQAYVKKAPSGKLSAFKKWEKKWMLFVLDDKKEPFLDFFDDRENVRGSTLRERIALSSTKQVIAAIDCKVPHNFLIITEERIVSLAARSQEDRDLWIAVLRRVLGERGCLQSTEDHEYEIHRDFPRPHQPATTSAATNRQSAGSTRRPPPPLPDDDADDFPPPVVRTATRTRSLPPRQSLTSVTANDFMPSRRHDDHEEALNNVREVLQQYQEYEDSPESSYESGDRRAIAAATNSASQARKPKHFQELSSLYAKVQRRPAEPAPSEPAVRIEHDFFPSQRKQPIATPRREVVRLPQTAGASTSPTAAQSNASLASETEDAVYMSMDPHIEALPIALELREAPPGYQQKVSRSELANKPVDSLSLELKTDSKENISEANQSKLPRPSSIVKRGMTLPLSLEPLETKLSTTDMYENAITLKEPVGGVVKVIPAPAPRRNIPLAPHTPNEDAYENAMGAFNVGRTSDKARAAFEGVTHTGRTPTKSPQLPKRQETDMASNTRPPHLFVPTLQENVSATTASTQSSLSVVKTSTEETEGYQAELLDKSTTSLDIPLADGEDDSSCSDGEYLVSLGLVKTTAHVKPSAPIESPRNSSIAKPNDNSESDDEENEVQLVSGMQPNDILSNDTPSMADAPPPYSPPRLLNDTQGNMSMIAEDEEVKQPHLVTSVETIGDYVDSQVQWVEPDATSLPVKKCCDKEKTTPSNSDTEVLRLEDTFPRMPKVSGPPKSVEETSPRPVSDPKKYPLSKSYSSALPVLGKNGITDSVEDEKDVKPRRPPKVFAQHRRSSSLTRERQSQAEYDSVIPEKKNANGNSSPAPIVHRRNSNDKSKVNRRVSAPPDTLSGLASAGMTGSESPKARARRSERAPLAGGMLLREGKAFRMPQHREDEFKKGPQQKVAIEMLKQEISHSYGVKVTVWRKDVKYAMFVDIMSGIWVAGWKQKERELLYQAFHVGDKIISVNHETFQSAAKLLNRIKRADSDTKFEFLIRRLPFGKAYHIRRNLEHEPIGIQLSPGSAEVCNVAAGSLIAVQGLRLNPNRAFGPGQTRWVITELNNEPLSQFSDGTEVEAKLKAGGKDITFVLQPWDIVDAIQRQLKSVFGYRDYLLKYKNNKN